MQYRNFGQTGKKLSLLGFGAMRLPEDLQESVKVIQKSFELGVNYLDTALAYGDSEKKCAVALKGWRDRVYVSTKNPLRDFTIDGWKRRLDESLSNLDTDYIDFYQVVHSLGIKTYDDFLIANNGMKAVHKAKDEGLIKHICFSTHDSPANVKKLIDSGEFEGLTIQYNLLDRQYEEVIAYAHQKGMGVIVMGPVGGGSLAAPSKQIQDMITTGVKSSAETALRFVFSNENVTCAISGMNTIEQVEENCKIASRKEPLSDEEKINILKSLEENKKLAELYCTGCSYCMPCPNNVNIPENFKIMNLHRVYGLTSLAKRRYSFLSNPDRPNIGKKAEECIECGICEPKCPQNIKIISQLKEVTKELSDNK
ncbi:MAG: aldo/keto reductase [Armatimonadota bacterium]